MGVEWERGEIGIQSCKTSVQNENEEAKECGEDNLETGGGGRGSRVWSRRKKQKDSD